MNKGNPVIKPADFRELTCAQCREGAGLGFEFTMAFQPIVDLPKKQIFAYEALVRGLNGEGADFILAKVNEANLYSFDQACQVRAIQLAAELGMSEKLSINFSPNGLTP
jgi:EAL domain-containing protein (putative c-di-GMP-specific phosphodiesterase class I)